MLTHPLRNSEVKMHYQNEPTFNGVYSRNHLPKIKKRAYVINIDELKLLGIHRIALYMNGSNGKYLDNFRVEHIQKRIKKFIGNKNIVTNVYRIQAYNTEICGYFYIGFIDFMLKCKSLLGYIDLFSPNVKNEEKT